METESVQLFVEPDLPTSNSGARPSPGDGRQKPSDPEASSAFDGLDEDVPPQVRKMRTENASLRERLRQLEAGNGDQEAGRRVRDELKQLKQQLADANPILKAHQEREEANKTELQRAQEALQTRERDYADLQVGYTRLELAAIHNVPPEDIDLIGSGTREEMEARAARVGALNASTTRTPAPPSNRPVEGLRPGATPEPPKPVDHSYPDNWGFQPQSQT